MLHLLYLHLLLLLDLLFVETLAKFLYFTPFIVANVRWHIFDFYSSGSIFRLANLCNIIHFCWGIHTTLLLWLLSVKSMLSWLIHHWVQVLRERSSCSRASSLNLRRTWNVLQSIIERLLRNQRQVTDSTWVPHANFDLTLSWSLVYSGAHLVSDHSAGPILSLWSRILRLWSSQLIYSFRTITVHVLSSIGVFSGCLSI